MKQSETPIYNALIRYQKGQLISLHVPGHKNGAMFPEKGYGTFRHLLSIDMTELPGLDDLHRPTGVIDEAEKLLSAFYHTEKSWFLIGGSTVGNLAMMQALCTGGDRVLIQRNCHKSVTNGVRLAGARPVFLGPEADAATMLATAPAPATVKEALQHYPEAKALVLTNPNYYGMTTDLTPLIEQAHEQGVPVVVDEAHGAHFALGRPFPNSALRSGADAVVHSAHKTLPAMTMGAYLHVQGPRIDQESVSEALRLLQSTSPSYPILASLDLARHYMAQQTEADLAAIYERVSRFRYELTRFPQFTVVGKGSKAYASVDPLKITLQTRCALNGFQLSQCLAREGIHAELADPLHVLFIMPLARFDEQAILDRIASALADVRPGGSPPPPLRDLRFPRLSVPVETSGTHGETVPLREAAGRIAMQEVTPYPPGVPLVFQGERITEAQVTAIQQWDHSGGRFQAGGDVADKGMHVVAGEGGD